MVKQLCQDSPVDCPDVALKHCEENNLEAGGNCFIQASDSQIMTSWFLNLIYFYWNRFSLVFIDSRYSWFSLIFNHWYSFILNDYHWYSFIPIGIVFHWRSLVFLDFHWFSLIFIAIVFDWFSMVIIDSHWFHWNRSSLVFIDLHCNWFIVFFIEIDLHWFSLIFIGFDSDCL